MQNRESRYFFWNMSQRAAKVLACVSGEPLSPEAMVGLTAPRDLCLVYSDSPPWVLESKGRVQKASVLLPWTTTSSVPNVPFYVESFSGWCHVWGALSVSHGDDAKGLGCAGSS